jgi:hypothetical protein
MRTYTSTAAARAALITRGYVQVAVVTGTDSTRFGYSRKVNGKLESAVLTVFSRTLATVRYL